MDLKDGYFQVLLTPELSDLTSFIVELKKYSWKFKFLRAPQGLCVSGDAFEVNRSGTVQHRVLRCGIRQPGFYMRR